MGRLNFPDNAQIYIDTSIVIYNDLTQTTLQNRRKPWQLKQLTSNLLNR